MSFFKWFLKENPFHIVIFLLGYFAMFVLWGIDGADDRRLAFPIWTFILMILIVGKYKYWSKIVKNDGKQ
jgi:hypothetical protein